MHNKILIETPSDYIRHLIINRPQQRNALDREAYNLLTEELKKADHDEAVRVIVISGQGTCFTAGNDLKDFVDQEHAYTNDHSPGVQLLLTLHNIEKPIIAAIEGYAIGIGTTMLNHCDLAYCGATARFRVPFTALGLSPEGGSSFYFPRLAGNKKATELLLFGNFFNAQEALEYHFVNEVIDENQAVSYALAKAKQLTNLPFHSILSTKKLLKKTTFETIKKTLEDEAKVFHTLRISDETQQIIAKFFNR